MPASKAVNFIKELQQTYLLPTESQKPTVFPSDYLWGLRKRARTGAFSLQFPCFCTSGISNHGHVFYLLIFLKNAILKPTTCILFIYKKF